MKKVLFASTATAALALGGMASAQGIALFGDARLGLGYNVNNAGGIDLEEGDDWQAISRVRFGVNMTGTTNSGITFGASVRADNAEEGQGGALGQRAGNAFVSGSFGVLSFGDTNGADEEHVGDVPGNLSLTGLGDLHESFFISNGGGFGEDEINFASNPDARPTIRYDFDLAGFGMSLSSNRDLTDVGAGASYTADLAGGAFTAGLGYYNYSPFRVDAEEGLFTGDFVDIDDVRVPVFSDPTEEFFTSGGNQYSAGIQAAFEVFDAGVTYTFADSDGGGEFQALALGAATSLGGIGGGIGDMFGDFGDVGIGAYYHTVLNAEGGDAGIVEAENDTESFGVTANYDLGGGAQIAGGAVRTFRGDFVDGEAEDGEWVGDFGIRMAF